jgi:hypothetical protein
MKGQFGDVVKILGVLSFVLLGGCLPLSIYPLYTDKEVVFDPALVGTWVDEQADSVWLLEEAAENSYLFQLVTEGEESRTFSVHLIRLGPHEFLDFFPLEEEGEDFLGDLLLPVHVFYKMERDLDHIRLRVLNEEWLTSMIASGKTFVSCVQVDEVKVIASTTETLQKFLIEHAQNEEAFYPDEHVLTRYQEESR